MSKLWLYLNLRARHFCSALIYRHLIGQSVIMVELMFTLVEYIPNFIFSQFEQQTSPYERAVE